jgi:ubiquinone/menaquinone biosynthesis C-methylase UbiE
MSTREDEMRETWDRSFEEQIARQAYNTAPVEALVRSMSYYLRDRYSPEEQQGLHGAELGCGAGPNLVWMAERGMRVSGVDISPTALDLCRQTLDRAGHSGRAGSLVEASVTDVPWEDASLDVALESCVFQHLDREERLAAFREVDRLVKPGGLFVGHMLEQQHTVFEKRAAEQLPEDPGTLRLEEGGSNVYLTNIGLSHFFTKDEFAELLPGWTVVDPCLSQYELPRAEAEKRGYDHYRQSMLIVFAIK